MVQANLSLFGNFTLAVNGIVVPPFPTDKIRALLAYLALEPERPHRREHLAGLFWPEVSQAIALKNLRQSLYRLRQTLDRVDAGASDAILHITQQTVELDADAVVVDVRQFQTELVESERHRHPELASCPACLARLRHTTELYCGELLTGLGVADAAEFEEWLTLHREMLHQQALLTLHNLAHAHEANGETEEAHRYASRMLTLDPYREETHRQIIRLLATRGLIHQALAQYDFCRRTLREELGVEPDAATVALVEQIYAGTFVGKTTQRAEVENPSLSGAQANHPDVATTDAATKLRASSANTLRALPSPLIGRQQELAAIAACLTGENCREVTLVGAGGVGKTSLALQVAINLQDHFVDGVCFVDLTSVLDPNLVPTTIAQALGVQERGAILVHTQLQEVLYDKHFLLVIDNFEQVITAAPLLAELLAACPKLKILVTSRHVLHLRVEQVFTIGPLSLPPLQPLLDANRLLQYSAVAFFVQRAQAALPTFQLTTDNAHAVAELCICLDGLPLAIELVAARLRMLPPHALLTRLTSMFGARLNLLTSGDQDRPRHQQTLQKTIDWSFQLLAPNLKTLFARLAIFVGGCTVEAAESICGDGSLPIPHDNGDLNAAVGSNTFDALLSLVDQSLIHQQVGADGEPRLLMLETIREYALEHLLSSGERESLQKRYVAYYLAVAEATGLLSDRKNMVSRLKRLEAEHGNLLAALAWSIETMHSSEDVLRLAQVLASFWYYRGYWREGRQLLERALTSTTADADNARRAQIGLHMAELAYGQGDYTAARSWLEESLAQFRHINDPIGIASALSILGLVVREQGDALHAIALTEESLARFRAQNAQISVPWTLCSLGEMLTMQGNTEQARRVLEESLQIFRKQGEQLGIGWVYNHLGHVAQLEHDYTRALAWHEASLPQFRDRDRNGMAWALCNLGQIAYAQHDLNLALSHYCASLVHFRDLGSRQGITWCLAGMAGIAASAEQLERAAWFWGAISALRAIERGRPAPGVIGYEEEALAAVRAQLPPELFSQAWREGETTSLEEVVTYALTSGNFVGNLVN